MPKDRPDWNESKERFLYFKSRGGRIYGRMKVGVYAFFDPPIAVTIDTWVNPNCSRNLEFDPNKTIDASRVQEVGLEKAIEEAKGR